MIEVRRAEPDEWAQVRAVRLAALDDAPDAFWAVLEEEADQEEAFWRSRLEAAERLTLLASLDGVDVGILGVGPHHDEPAAAGVYSVWVAPDARGSGAAEALVDEAVRWGREEGYRRLRLDLGDHNVRAAAFYRRAGFVPTGVTGSFPAPRDHITEHELALDL